MMGTISCFVEIAASRNTVRGPSERQRRIKRVRVAETKGEEGADYISGPSHRKAVLLADHWRAAADKHEAFRCWCDRRQSGESVWLCACKRGSLATLWLGNGGEIRGSRIL